MASNEQEIERLVVRLVGDGRLYERMLEHAEAKTKQSTSQIEGVLNNLQQLAGSGFGQLASQVIGLTGALGGLGAVFQGVRLAAEAEENTIAFGVMLKSMERGKSLVEDLQTFAAKTPMGTGDLQNASKTLLQFGVAASDLLPIMKQLGDVTGGNSQRFSQMAYAFGQMSATGRLMGQDLAQMINAGFNPLQEMARTSGKSMAALKDELEKGKISLEMVRAAFASASGEGGQFAGLMEKQSHSLKGLFSTMQDDASSFFRTFGVSVADSLRLKDAMQAVSTSFQTFTQILQENRPWLEAAVKILASLVIPLAAIAALGGGVLATAAAVTALGTAITATGVALTGLVAIATGPASLIIMGFVTAATFLKVLYDWYMKVSGAAQKYNDTVLLASVANEKLAKNAFMTDTQRAAEVFGIEDEDEKKAKATDLLKDLEADTKVWEESLADARKEFERLDGPINRLRKNPALEEAKQRMETINYILRERIQLQEAVEKASKGAAENAAVEKMLKDLSRQTEMVGKTEVHKARMAALDAGASQNQADQVEAAAALLEFTKRTAEYTKARVALEKQDVKDEDMAFLGIGKHAKGVLDLMEKFPEQKNELDEAFQKALGRDQADAAKETYEALKKEGDALNQQFDPLAKYNHELEKLNKLKERGVITGEVYDRALQEAAKHSLELADGTRQAHEQLARFDAVSANSAEALWKVNQQIAMVNEDPLGFTGNKPGAGREVSRPFDAAAAFGPEAQSRGQTQNETLADIRDILKKMSGNPIINLLGAGLR